MSNVELDDELLDPVSSRPFPILSALSAYPSPVPRKGGAAPAEAPSSRAPAINAEREGGGRQAGPCRDRGQVRTVRAELGDNMMKRRWGPQRLGDQGGRLRVSESPAAEPREWRWGRCTPAGSTDLSWERAGSKARGVGTVCGRRAPSGLEVALGTGISGVWDLGQYDVLFSCPVPGSLAAAGARLLSPPCSPALHVTSSPGFCGSDRPSLAR